MERAIVMPRDLDNYHPEYPKVMELLPVNPWRKKAETKKKKGKKDEDGTVICGIAAISCRATVAKSF